MNDLLFSITSWCDDEALTRLSRAGVDISPFYKSDHWWLTRIGHLFGQTIPLVITYKPERWKNVYQSLIYSLRTITQDQSSSADPFFRICRASALPMQAASIEVLLQTRDPSELGFYTFSIACLEGQVDILKLIEADPRIDISMCAAAGLQCVNAACDSAEGSTLDAIMFLLSNTIFDSEVQFWAAQYATKNEPTQAMKLVIEAAKRGRR